MAWILLLIAGALEIVWVYFMKQSAGFSRPGPSLVTLAAMIGSFALLAIAMRTLPMGTAYVVWTGIGALGALLVGWLVLGEPLGPGRALGATLLLAGMALMKLSTR